MTDENKDARQTNVMGGKTAVPGAPVPPAAGDGGAVRDGGPGGRARRRVNAPMAVMVAMFAVIALALSGCSGSTQQLGDLKFNVPKQYNVKSSDGDSNMMIVKNSDEKTYMFVYKWPAPIGPVTSDSELVRKVGMLASVRFQFVEDDRCKTALDGIEYSKSGIRMFSGSTGHNVSFKAVEHNGYVYMFSYNPNGDPNAADERAFKSLTDSIRPA